MFRNGFFFFVVIFLKCSALYSCAVLQVEAQIRPQNVSLSNFSVVMNSSVADDNDTVTNHINITYLTTGCSVVPFNLLAVNSSGLQGSGALVSASRMSAVTEAVQGYVTLELFNGQRLTFDHLTSATQVRMVH